MSLTACGSTSDPESSPSDSGTGEEITHLVMAFPTWTGAPADTQMVQDAINEITVEKLGIEVELQIYDAGSYGQSLTFSVV